MSEQAASVSSPRDGGPLARTGPIFAALIGLTTLAILLQAVFAGEFVDRSHTGGWLSAHNANAVVVIALAVITAIYAVVALRNTARALVIGSIVLAVLVIVQTVIGHAITDDNDNGLLVIHVPLAMLAFGLTIWLSVKARSLRRAAAAPRA
ncbi:MAG: hypothetical protein ABSB73_09505 [Solirubrobacteraceae bacterium]